MLTADLKHDKFAVYTFEKATLDHLKKKGFVPERIIQFCDRLLRSIQEQGAIPVYF